MGYIFTVPVEDVQYLAMKKFGRELTFDELHQVKKALNLDWNAGRALQGDP